MQFLRKIYIVMAAAIACSCSEDDKGTPMFGEVTYDVTYSEDIVENTSVGSFLPRTVIGVYDTSSVKLTMTAPLGVGHADLVLATAEDFVAVEFDEAKLLLSMEDIFEADSAKNMAGGLKIAPMNDANISGFESHHLAVFPMTADSVDTRMDIFFVPFPNQTMEYDATKFIEAKTSHKPAPFGVITAINVRLGQSNIMLMATSIKAKNDLKPDDFKRPKGFVQASRKDLMTLYDMMLN